MTRPSQARIDLEALRHNARHLQALHGGRQLAVLKADAYGHGAIDCARALRGLSDGLAVAFVDEARVLRAAGLTAPILVLEGAFDADEVAFAAAASLWLVVHQDRQLNLIEQADPPEGSLHLWLKIDSGMHRAGFAPERARELHRRLQGDPRVASLTLMSHFARADEPGCDLTARQTALFEQATAGLPGPRSLCNSAGVLAWPSAHRDWARPGIALYGADPLLRPEGSGLRPVMTLASEVFAERWLAAGEPLGYGSGFTATEPTRVGLVALGYADGYPRTAPTGTPVAVDSRPSRLIGRVSMDMLTVDLTRLPDAGIGSTVELWGRQIAVNAVASAAGTLSYELLCGIKRVQRYTGSTSRT